MKSEPKLGELITGAESRDAIHIAICPAIAGEPLKPGEEIGIIRQSWDELEVMAKGFKIDNRPIKMLGIVDPFLKARVEKGQTFWMFLFPNTITSLKHVWEHPNFPRQ